MRPQVRAGHLEGGAVIAQADAAHIPLADETVQCIVTSPPYFGLRKYAGIPENDHAPFGLESTVEAYVESTLRVLYECWRVVRADGVLFWNIGDSYNNTNGFSRNKPGHQWHRKGRVGGAGDKSKLSHPTIKIKDLCLIPERVALAAQAAGWYVRSRIIWHKPSAMPESVRDRPTVDYETIWMLTKSARYYWDAEAVREPHSAVSIARAEYEQRRQSDNGFKSATRQAGMKAKEVKLSKGGKNLRTVWRIAPDPYPGAHYATFPPALPRRCILAATKLGDLVLDPFAGTCTVGQVAQELGRRFVCLDLSYHYLRNMGLWRVAKVAPKDGVSDLPLFQNGVRSDVPLD